MNGKDYTIKDIGENISPDDIPAAYMDLVDCIGLEGTVRLCERYGGECTYIPKAHKMHNFIRNQRIKREYNGYNLTDLARKYDLSVMRVRQILGEAVSQMEG